MTMPVPIPPSWDAVHPLIVHFPIGLLLVAPVFLFLGIVVPRHGTCFSVSALILMAAGTVSAYIAVSTGEAAGMLAPRTPEISEVLEKHEELAELTLNLFTALTAVFAVYLTVPFWIRKKPGPRLSLLFKGLFLAVYMLSTLAVVWTGHHGGRLVHQYGVRASAVAV